MSDHGQNSGDQRWSTKLATLAFGVAGITVTAAGPASADVTGDVAEGQFVNKKGLHCGGQERVVASPSLGTMGTEKHAWVYYNCGKSTVRRYADIGRSNPDGKCYGIGPGQARVLDTILTVPGLGNIYNGSKPC